MKLSVSVDLDLTAITIRPAGVLGTANVSGLLAVINRAARTLPDLAVRLDLQHLHSTCEEALRLLYRSVAEVTPGTGLALNPPSRASEPRLAA